MRQVKTFSIMDTLSRREHSSWAIFGAPNQPATFLCWKTDCCRAILHDPTSYPEPENFKPERFLSSDGKFIEDQKLSYGFGFGIRYDMR